jgi:hypothetical protein
MALQMRLLLTLSLLALPSFALAAATAAPAPAPPSGPVDLELVLATDTSPSIDATEARLQRQGIAAAFRSPEVIRAIGAGSLGRIAVAYLDWSSIPYNALVVNWTIIHDQKSATAFSNALLRAPLTYGSGTSISGAMEIGARLIESNRLEGTRKTIDISGDGPNNRGMTVIDARDAIVAKGITINGLPIVTYEYGVGDWGTYYLDIEQYYANCVVGGRGSFSLPAKGFADFANAVRRKLVLEISGLKPGSESNFRADDLRESAPPVERKFVSDPIFTKVAAQPQLPGTPNRNRVPRENCVTTGFLDGGPL